MLDLFTIIYVTPFYFPNGNPAKNKYLIPIAEFEDKILFTSLPTSKDFVPDILLKHGCINDIPRQISCYVFLKDTSITNCNFSFDRNTFMYFYQMLNLPIRMLKEVYTKVDVDYEVIGELNNTEKLNLIDCLLTSRFISRKVKRKLAEYKKIIFKQNV